MAWVSACFSAEPAAGGDQPPVDFGEDRVREARVAATPPKQPAPGGLARYLSPTAERAARAWESLTGGEGETRCAARLPRGRLGARRGVPTRPRFAHGRGRRRASTPRTLSRYEQHMRRASAQQRASPTRSLASDDSGDDVHPRCGN